MDSTCFRSAPAVLLDGVGLAEGVHGGALDLLLLHGAILHAGAHGGDAWNIAQRICGVVLGVLASLALFWDGIFSTSKEQGGFSFSLIAAVVIAMLVPNIIEKQGLRKIPKARTTMAIALLVCIVVYLAFIGLTKGFGSGA